MDSWNLIDGGAGSTSMPVAAAGADNCIHWLHVRNDKRVYTDKLVYLIAE
jgi:hypothetical protein